MAGVLDIAIWNTACAGIGIEDGIVVILEDGVGRKLSKGGPAAVVRVGKLSWGLAKCLKKMRWDRQQGFVIAP